MSVVGIGLLLETARRSGLVLRAKGDNLEVCGPKSAEPLAQELIRRKQEVLPALRERSQPGSPGNDSAGWASLPLRELENEQVAIKIDSQDYGTLWLVSTEAERTLADDGFPTYTVAEAQRMIDLPDPLVRQIHEFKKTFGCTLDRLARKPL